jgi:hypothetical protein
MHGSSRQIVTMSFLLDFFSFSILYSRHAQGRCVADYLVIRDMTLETRPSVSILTSSASRCMLRAASSFRFVYSEASRWQSAASIPGSTAGLLVAGSMSVLSFSSVFAATVSQEEEGIQFSWSDLKAKSHEFLLC